MERITPEQVVEAYKTTGLKPVRHITLKDGCACGLGAVYAQKLNVRTECVGEVFTEIKKYGLSPSYVSGFIAGFDGVDFDEMRDVLIEDESIGYEDGQAAWKAVVDAGLIKG